MSFFDITVKNPLTNSPLKLHPFRHKGYWFHGAKRESAELQWFQRLVSPNDCVWEVGAHIGFVTQWFAQLVGPGGKVIAFEPGAENLRYLQTNVSHFTNSTIQKMAVCDINGSVVLNVEDLSGQNNSLIESLPVLQTNAQAAGIKPRCSQELVHAVTLDSFRETESMRPNFIKIDVEGAEYQVLLGARNMLREDQPILMVELMIEPARSIVLLKELGYRCFYTDCREVFVDNLPSSSFTNVFAVPAESPQIALFTQTINDVV